MELHQLKQKHNKKETYITVNSHSLICTTRNISTMGVKMCRKLVKMCILKIARNQPFPIKISALYWKG